MMFTIKNHKMLFWRLGNMNSIKQKHFGQKQFHQPPVRRGIWCFPYPYYDLFFAYHQWEAKLPKKFRKLIGEERLDVTANMTDEEAETYWNEREEAMKKVRKIYRPKTFWYNGKFYSHISINGKVDYNQWYLWDSVSHWSEEAKKHVVSYFRYDDRIYKETYAKDHLEIFIPNF